MKPKEEADGFHCFCLDGNIIGDFQLGGIGGKPVDLGNGDPLADIASSRTLATDFRHIAVFRSLNGIWLSVPYACGHFSLLPVTFSANAHVPCAGRVFHVRLFVDDADATCSGKNVYISLNEGIGQTEQTIWKTLAFSGIHQRWQQKEEGQDFIHRCLEN